MSKMNNKWNYLTDYEKLKAKGEVERLYRIKLQKERVNKVPVEERIEDIKR